MAGLVGVSAALIRRNRRGPAQCGRVLLALAAAGIGFQIFHAAEHIAQAGFWLAQPAALPWLTRRGWPRVGRSASRPLSGR